MQKNKEEQKIILLGDFHGEWAALFRKLDGIRQKGFLLICVGDVGIGLKGAKDSRDFSLLNEKFKSRNIEFISCRGNHDLPSAFDGLVNFPNFKLLKDYTVLEINGEIWQFVGGGLSVNRKWLTRGYDYWKEEVFVFDPVKARRCDVLITHTGPPWIGPASQGGFVQPFIDRDLHLHSELVAERAAMLNLYDACRPKKAFLGHFHRSEEFEYHGDGYICEARILDELELFEYRK